MPQIVDRIDHVKYHGDYLYNRDENTVLVIYGGLVKEAAVKGSDDPLRTARQLLRTLVAIDSLTCGIIATRMVGC